MEPIFPKKLNLGFFRIQRNGSSQNDSVGRGVAVTLNLV